MTYEQIEVRRDGPVAWVTLNRPNKLNALTFRIWDELADAFTVLNGDSAAHCVVLTGAGRGFCAGRDLDDAAVEELTPGHLRAMQCSLIPVIVRSPQPVIAAVNGAAAGAGLALALACDLRVASDAARFTVGFLRMGLVPDAGASYLLVRAVGYAKAFELAATSDVIDAPRALAMGLVNQVVPAGSLQQEVRALAAKLAGMPPLAVRATKTLFRAALHEGLMECLERETEVQPEMLRAADHREAVTAFLEKRPPRFHGR